MKRICVIGSLNVDFVTSVEHFPKPGQSVFARSFNIFPGGKGANQAVALGRLGADVLMVGKLGDRLYGSEYISILKENHVCPDGVAVEKDQYTGIAPITVDKNGENMIVVYPGANDLVDVKYIEEKWELFCSREIFLFQLEIPMETNLYAMKRLKELGRTVILDPAPAKELPKEIFGYVDYLTPNETELEALSGVAVEAEADIEKAARKLIDKGARTVIAKAGKRGAFIISPDEFIPVRAFPVKAVDPTAAGDSFNAGLAFALSRSMGLYESVRFANAVAGLSTTAMGAQSAMPTYSQVEEFLSGQGK